MPDDAVQRPATRYRRRFAVLLVLVAFWCVLWACAIHTHVWFQHLSDLNRPGRTPDSISSVFEINSSGIAARRWVCTRKFVPLGWSIRRDRAAQSVWAQLPLGWQRLWFGWELGNNTDWYVAVPYWAILLLHLGPMAWLRFKQRQWDKAAAVGRCQVCGYDLRATPERCPECGSPAEPAGAT